MRFADGFLMLVFCWGVAGWYGLIRCRCCFGLGFHSGECCFLSYLLFLCLRGGSLFIRFKLEFRVDFSVLSFISSLKFIIAGFAHNFAEQIRRFRGEAQLHV